VLLLALGGWAQAANGADPLTLDVSLGIIPPAVGLGSAPALWVGDRMLSVLPATVRVEAGASVPLLVAGGGFGFRGMLKRGPQGFTIEPGSNSHCQPYNGEWKVSSKGEVLAIVLDVKKVGDWGCNQSSSIGAPDGRGKLRFATLPPGGTLYYPKSSGGFLVEPTPGTLVVDFTVRQPRSAIFKKPGYYDCAVQLSFQAESGAYFVSAGGVRLGAMTDTTANAPTVTCDLKPAPKGTLANPGK